MIPINEISEGVKGKPSGGATSDPMRMQQNDDTGPTFRSRSMDVSCDISRTTWTNRDSDGILERRDLWLSFPGSEKRIE